VEWTGAMPFEIAEMRATAAGFDFVFTKPLDPASAAAGAFANCNKIESYAYLYHRRYGSDELDLETHAASALELSADGKNLKATIPGLRAGTVVEFHADGLRSSDGESLLHPRAYYTLNCIPR
jgi:hypothetical protein